MGLTCLPGPNVVQLQLAKHKESGRRIRSRVSIRKYGLGCVLKSTIFSRRSAPLRVLVKGLLERGGLAMSATRDYAKKDVTTGLASIPKDSSCFGKKVITCSGRVGRSLLKISSRALGGRKTIDRRAIVRVMGNTVGTLGASYTISASKVTNPDKKAGRGPIKAI